jgi:hypothetical protein
VVVPAVPTKSDVAVELQQTDPIKEEQKKPASITSLNFFNTYSSSKGKIQLKAFKWKE